MARTPSTKSELAAGGIAEMPELALEIVRVPEGDLVE